VQQQMLVRWTPFGWGDYTLLIWNNASDTSTDGRIVDIYMYDTTTPAFTYDSAHVLIQLDYDKGGSGYWLDSFNIEHDIKWGNEFYTPNDNYVFLVPFLAIERATNKSVPIFNLACGGVGSDFIAPSKMGVTRPKFTYETANGSTTVGFESRALEVKIRRSTRAKMLTFSMFAINWILVSCSVITTSLFFSPKRDVKEGFALLPLTVILTIPSIRALYSGSPSFGIFFDLVGFFPQMVAAVACIIATMYGFVRPPVRDAGVTDGKGEV